MPEIDVSDVLLDPIVAGENFTVFRRRQIMGENGVASVSPSVFNYPVGSIQPLGENSLVRQDAYQVQAKSIQVITTFRLYGEAKKQDIEYQPDLIYWAGDYYLVRVVEDWSKYGVGMIEAQCSSIDYVDLPPGLPPMAYPQGALIFSNPANSGLIAGAVSCF